MARSIAALDTSRRAMAFCPRRCSVLVRWGLAGTVIAPFPVRRRKPIANDQDDKITSGILGLGGAPVPKEPGDPSADETDEARAQRRARMQQGEAEARTGETPHTQGPGATGIDMGAGGTGTDIDDGR